MRKAISFLLMVVAVLCNSQDGFAIDYVSGYIYMSQYELVRDVHFMTGASVVVDSIVVRESLRLENDADIFGDIDLCDGCNVSIRNSGSINGRIHVGSGTDLVQLVHDKADMTFLDVDASYTVLVDGARDLVWGDLKLMGAGAGRLILNDASVIFTDDTPSVLSTTSAMPRIELHGVITVNVADDFVAGSAPVMHNISSNADIIVRGGTTGPLHVYAAQVRDEELYISLVRETDYYKILGNNQGLALNQIRAAMPNDALLRRLDGADNMDEINHILSHSIAFNPIRLMRPVHVLDAFMDSGVRLDGNIDDNAGNGRVYGFFIGASDWNMGGALADFVMRPVVGVTVGLSLYAAMAESDDAVNTFSGQMIGGRLSGRYDDNGVMARLSAGATMAGFEAPYIFDGDRLRTHARGFSVYSSADIGPRYGTFVPYVGAEYHRSQILGQSDVDVNARAGVDAALGVRGTELRYEYKANAGVNTAAVFYSGVGIGVTSPDDMLGADVAFNLLADKDEHAWAISLSARALF